MQATSNIFDQFPIQSKLDWESLVSKDSKIPLYIKDFIQLNSYQTAEDQNHICKDINFLHEQLLKNKIKSNLLFESPDYKLIDINLSQDYNDKIANFIKQLIDNKDIPFYAFKISIENNFLYTIANFRAIRVLMNRILTCIKFPNKNYTFPIFVDLKLDNAKSEHQNLILINWQIMASLISNINGIIIPENCKYQTSRLIQNIYNIHLLETDISQYQDIAFGSYFIDRLTSEIINYHWNKLQHFQF